jgi:hypothetical protein
MDFLRKYILNSNNEWNCKNNYKKYLPTSKIKPKSKKDLVNKKYVDQEIDEQISLLNLKINNIKQTQTLNLNIIDNTNNIDTQGNYFIPDNFYSIYTKNIQVNNSIYNYFGIQGGISNGNSEYSNIVINDIVFDSKNNMYMCGEFNRIGDLDCINIAKFDGSKWYNLGEGLNNTAICMVIDSNDNLYVGGQFSSSGIIQLNNIGKWNGLIWSSLASGLSDTCLTIRLDSSNNLIAGGFFLYNGDNGDNLIQLNYIGKYNGMVWEKLDNGLNGEVRALAIDSSNNIYAGGDLNYPVSKFNGTNWVSLQDLSGNKLTNYIGSMAIKGNNLYIGGLFENIGSIFAINLVMFNILDSTWNPILDLNGAGVNEQVLSIYINPDNSLYLAGNFVNLSDNSLIINHVAKFNGTNFVQLQSGLNDYCTTIIPDPVNKTLFIGGRFTKAGTKNIIGLTNYSNDYINLFWKSNIMYTLDNFNKSIIIYSSNNNNQYIGFYQNQNNLVTNI